MAALRLVQKYGVPVATAATIPILAPVVFADSGKKESSAPTSRMVRPSELPIYEEPEEVLDFEYLGKERTALEENVGVVRKEIEGVLEATRSVRERTVNIYETGKAHTMATVDYITDEENMLPRAGAITIGGLAGLVVGARKKGGFVKKVLYTSAGVISTASLCYPRQAYQISQSAYENVKDYGTIGYNFVAGVKPQSKVATPVEVKKEAPETAADHVPPVLTPEEPPPPPSETHVPTTEPEGAEVRSVIPQILPQGKFPAPIDSLAQQASDVTLWGFRLTDSSSTATSSLIDVVLPAEPTVLEGFGSVGEIKKDDLESMVKEELNESDAKVVKSVKDSSLAEPLQLTQSEKLVGTVVDVAKDLDEKVADVVEEKVADAVKEKVADVVEEKVADVVKEKVADVVEEKVADVVEEKVADVVEEKVADVVKEKVADGVEEKVADVVKEKVADVVEVKVADVVEEKVADAVKEKVADVVEEKVADVVEEKVADVVEEKVADVVEAKVADVVEAKVADFAKDIALDEFADIVEEKVADVVVEAAQEVEKDTEKVVETAEMVEEVGSKVESVLDVAETVAEAAVEAAHDTEGVSEAVTEKLELAEQIIKEAEKVVEEVTHIAEKVKEVAEEIKKEAEIIETQASEIMQREEIMEEVIKFVKETPAGLPDTGELKETSEVTPEESEKKLNPESATEEPPVEVKEPLLEMSSESREKKGLFNKLISFFSYEKTLPFVEPEREYAVEKAKDLKTESTIVTDTESPSPDKNLEEPVENAESEVKTVESEAVSSPDKTIKVKKSEILDSIVEVFEPVMEDVGKDVVVDVAEGALESVAEVVNATDVIDDIEEKVVLVLDAVQETEETWETPGVSRAVTFEAEVKQVSEGVTDNVGDVVEIIKEEARIIETENAKLVVGSKEKQEELVENVIEYVSGISSSDEVLAKELKDQSETMSEEPEQEGSTQETEAGQKLASETLVEDIASKAVVKEGLFDKFVSVFSKKEENEDLAEVSKKSVAVPVTEEIKEPPVEAVTEEGKDEVLEKVEKPSTDTNIVVKEEEEVVQKIKEPGADTRIVVKEKEGLVDKLLSLFSRDEEKEVSTSAGEVKEPASDLTDTGVKEETSEDIKLPYIDVPEAGDEKEGLVDKLADLFSKKEKREDSHFVEPIEIPIVEKTESVEELPTGAGATAAEPVITTTEAKSVVAVDVLLGAQVSVEEPSMLDVKVQEESSKPDTQQKEPDEHSAAQPDVKLVEPTVSSLLPLAEREGLFDEFVNFFNKDEGKEHVPIVDVVAEDKDASVADVAEETKAVPSLDVVTEVKRDQPLQLDMKAEELSSALDTMEKEAEEQPAASVVVVDTVESAKEGGLFGKLVSSLSKDEDKKDVPEVKMEEPAKLDIIAEVAKEQSSSFSVVETGEPTADTLSPSKTVGLFDRIVNILSKDESKDVSVTAAVIEDKGEVSVTAAVIEGKGDVSVAVDVPATEVKEEVKSDQIDVKLQEPVVETLPTSSEKEGILSKLSSIFSKDDGEKDVLTEDPAPVSEMKELDEKSSDVPLDAVAPTAEKEGLFDKLASMLSKDVNKEITAEQVPEDKSAAEEMKEAPVGLPQQQEVKEEIVDFKANEGEPLSATEEREGLFDKLVNVFSKKDKDTDAVEKVEESHTDQGELGEQTSTIPVKVSDTSNEKSSVLAVEQPDAVVVPETISLLDKIAGIFSGEKKESVSEQVGDASESSEIIKSSPSAELEDLQVQSSFVVISGEGGLDDTPVSPSGETSQVPSENAAVVNAEEPVFEVKNKGLFDRLAELVSGDDKKGDLISIGESPAKSEPETLPQATAISQDVSGKSESGSSEVVSDSKSSLMDRIIDLFTKKEDSTEVEKRTGSLQPVEEVPSETTEQSKDETVVADNDETFVVKAKPNSVADVGAAEYRGQQRNDAAVSAWQGWFRTGASVKQEGKDVIVQLTPPSPPVETDYGQSNPEDSDMYTTRS